MKIPLIIISTIIIILGIGYFATNSNQPTKITTEVTITPTTTEVARQEDSSPNKTPGLYTTYDEQKITQSTADQIYLFFHATWCPTCRVLESDILKNSSKIPTGVEIYKVDYDKATTLKQKYGITVQHSVIKITSDGTAISTITHPPTLATLLTS